MKNNEFESDRSETNKRLSNLSYIFLSLYFIGVMNLLDIQFESWLQFVK